MRKNGGTTTARSDGQEKKIAVAGSRRKLLRFGSSFTLLFTSAAAILTLALSSFAWFAANQDTKTHGVAIQAESELFDLGVVTNAQGTARKDDVMSQILDLLPQRPDRVYGRDDLRTGGVSGVICALLADVDPMTGEAPPLRPGSTGTLQFRIFPRRDDLAFLGLASMGGTRKVVDLETTEQAIVTYELLDPENSATDREALDYLAGHLLFFTDAARTELVPYGESFAVTGATEAGGDYLVTLYWTWPRTYGELTALFSEQITNVTWQEWSETHSYLYQETGSLGYNNADQVIGERINQVIVELDMNAGSADALPSGIPTVAAVAQ